RSAAKPVLSKSHGSSGPRIRDNGLMRLVINAVEAELNGGVIPDELAYFGSDDFRIFVLLYDPAQPSGNLHHCCWAHPTARDFLGGQPDCRKVSRTHALGASDQQVRLLAPLFKS